MQISALTQASRPFGTIGMRIASHLLKSLSGSGIVEIEEFSGHAVNGAARDDDSGVIDEAPVVEHEAIGKHTLHPCGAHNETCGDRVGRAAIVFLNEPARCSAVSRHLGAADGALARFLCHCNVAPNSIDEMHALVGADIDPQEFLRLSGVRGRDECKPCKDDGLSLHFGSCDRSMSYRGRD